jgi:hypothetical protein
VALTVRLRIDEFGSGRMKKGAVMKAQVRGTSAYFHDKLDFIPAMRAQ